MALLETKPDIYGYIDVDLTSYFENINFSYRRATEISKKKHKIV